MIAFGFQILPWAPTQKGLKILIPLSQNAIELMGQIQLLSNSSIALGTADKKFSRINSWD